jgi:hypothetical protein
MSELLPSKERLQEEMKSILYALHLELDVNKRVPLAVKTGAGKFYLHTWLKCLRDRLHAVDDTLRSMPVIEPPAATEPMGWARVFPDGRHEVSHGKWRESDHHDSERWTVIPLYARAGQPPEVAQMRAILDDIAVAAWADPEPAVTLDSFLAWLRSELQPYVNAPTKIPSHE